MNYEDYMKEKPKTTAKSLDKILEEDKTFRQNAEKVQKQFTKSSIGI